ncbi:MAG: TetR family transcriptional regulator [Bacteroidetes bacterium]|jgi:AcrR family transcriptional regulator|nr:TetR family transcriptional regulator [Bacteroidota bacterium]
MDIVEATRDLFMRYGIRSVTMADISRELGVSKKTIYQQLSSKEDLVKRVMEFDTEKERNQIISISEHSKDAIDQMVQTTIYMMKKMRQISPAMHYDLQKYYGVVWTEIERRKLSFIYEVLKKNIEWGKSEELYRESIDAEIISRFFVHKAALAVDEVYFPLDTYQRDELLMQLMSYHLNGITTKTGVVKWRLYKKTLNSEKKKDI